eukprot:CAMPEP_0185272342 /NCGR_PEP_ID=MMETSP1359-20130426/46962_1 /TAXON_ID=552665 /ORGANISM="Bigelowiella longifila, Strain CCMP242" /LENGTH=133 /DNA_ID=CAMNT_0027864589 /DNA_START=166 /DNA_END=567 /DNA_ORIENTATION=-
MKMKLHRLAMEKKDIEDALKSQGIDLDNLMIEESDSKKSKKKSNAKPKDNKEKSTIKMTPSTITKAAETISGRRSRRELVQNSSNETMDQEKQNRGRRTTRSASRKKKMKAKARARGRSKVSVASVESKMEID